MELAIESGDTNTFLTVTLGKDDIIDEFDYGMIKNNSISGFLPVVYVEINDIRKFKYNITSTISLQRFLASEINRNTFLTLLKSFQKAFAEQQEYMMQQEYILLDYDSVFVDPTKCEIRLVCVPITSAAKEQKLGAFFKDLLFHVKYKKNEDNTCVAELINFLSVEKVFSLEKFGKILDEMTVGRLSGSDRQYEYVFRSTGKISNSLDSMIQKQNPVKEKEIKNKVQKKQDTGLSMGFRIPEVNKQNFQNTEESLKPENSKKGFSLFSKKTRQEGKNENKLVNDQVESRQQFQLNNDDEILKGYEINSDGQLIPCDGRRGRDAIPYLIRVSNNERIEIKYEVFRLGRGRKYTNYCIEDNLKVGRNHADIIKQGQEYKIIDNNSKNHTYVDGEQITGELPVSLKHGSRIRLSDEEFIFCLY
ncbi:MAG: FHA domain-containing protein [Lachnospiraceae bacterium]|nr:FHA domain-containing protein [Lachnospiraceae bacterium]